MNWKRGQVTIYIIIGIILVFTVLIYGTIRLVTVGEVPGAAEKGEELTVEGFVNKCVRDLSLDAVTLVGERGGYTDTSELSYRPDKPTESDGIKFSEDGSLIPYWWHMEGKDRSSQFIPGSNRPQIEDIQKDLQGYISTNLLDCVGDFSAFAARGIEVTPLAEPITEVEFGRDVVVNVDFPLFIEDTATGKTRTEKEFEATVDVNFKPIYDLATIITAAEANTTILENNIRDLISTFGKRDTNKIPPTSDLTLEADLGTTWLTLQVKDRFVEQILVPYTSALQVSGTLNYDKREVDPATGFAATKQRAWDDKTLPFGDIPELKNLVEDYDVRFLYLPTWPAYFNINDAGGIVRPTGFGVPELDFILGLFRLKIYNIAYDVSYPVLVMVTDPKALDGEGYTFMFALEANLRNNQPVKFGQSYLLEGAGQVRSIFCDDSQRISGEIGILVKSGDENVGGAEVNYKCLDDACFMGRTDSAGSLKSKFPICTNGLLTVSREGYLENSAELATEADKTDSITVDLPKLIELDSSFKKKNVEKINSEWTFINQDLGLEQNEEAFIVLVRNSVGAEGDYSAIARIKGDEKQKIKLAPGDYNISILIKKDASLRIPEEERCEGGVLGIGEECFTVPEFTLAIIASATELNNTVLSKSQLSNSKEIVFYGLSSALDQVPEVDRKIEDIEALGLLIGVEGEEKGFSNQNRQSLLPVLR